MRRALLLGALVLLALLVPACDVLRASTPEPLTWRSFCAATPWLSVGAVGDPYGDRLCCQTEHGPICEDARLCAWTGGCPSASRVCTPHPVTGALTVCRPGTLEDW